MEDKDEYEYPKRYVQIIHYFILILTVACVVFWNIYSEKEKEEWFVKHQEELHLFLVADIFYLVLLLFCLILAGWTFFKAIETIKENRYPPQNYIIQKFLEGSRHDKQAI